MDNSKAFQSNHVPSYATPGGQPIDLYYQDADYAMTDVRRLRLAVRRHSVGNHILTPVSKQKPRSPVNRSASESSTLGILDADEAKVSSDKQSDDLKLRIPRAALGFLSRHAGTFSLPSTLRRFDVLSGGWPMTTACLWIFREHGIFSAFNIDFISMEDFLRLVELGYKTNVPYHNRAHASDVVLRMYSILLHGLGLMEMEESQQKFYLLTGILAAAVHDYTHPGSDNKFQADMGSRAGLVFDQSPIENLCAERILSLLDFCDVFTQMPMEDFGSDIRQDISKLLLATDMARHFELLSQFKDLVDATRSCVGQCDDVAKDPDSCSHQRLLEARQGSAPFTETTTRATTPAELHVGAECFSGCDHDQRMLIMMIALKISDLGHCCLSWDEHMEWVKRLEEEFFTQGDAERDAELDVSYLKDRMLSGLSDHQSSIGFFQTFVLPMLETWIRRFPSCAPLLDQASINLSKHQECASESEIDSQASSKLLDLRCFDLHKAAEPRLEQSASLFDSCPQFLLRA